LSFDRAEEHGKDDAQKKIQPLELEAEVVSFACAVGALKTSTLMKRVNAGAFDAVPAELMKWTKANTGDFHGNAHRLNDVHLLFHVSKQCLLRILNITNRE
jgi:GH24 family phage-related lysozyme (muramidase)